MALRMPAIQEALMSAPIRVAVTGAAGNIGYSLLWRIASGSCFGPDQPVILQLLEIPPVMDKLNGVVMELVDSAFPLVQDIVATSDAEVAFGDADQLFLVGSRPRSKGMLRSDLVAANGPIFVGQGKAIEAAASRDAKVIVVGNPCNTNCLIANHYAPSVKNFSAMTRLDQNRAKGQIGSVAGVATGVIDDVIIWGNHSPTMYPYVGRATIDGKAATDVLDADWIANHFHKTVSTRGKAIIEARGASSAASAASASIDHMHDWFHGSNGRIVSMAVRSEGWYGVPEGLIFSFPHIIDDNGVAHLVEDIALTDYDRQKIQVSIDELVGEREAVKDLLG